MKTLERYVYTRSGHHYKLQNADTYEFDAKSLTDSVLHRLICANGSVLIIQGDEISHFTFREINK